MMSVWDLGFRVWGVGLGYNLPRRPEGSHLFAILIFDFRSRGSAGKRKGNNLNGLKIFCTKNGSSLGQNLALTG